MCSCIEIKFLMQLSSNISGMANVRRPTERGRGGQCTNRCTLLCKEALITAIQDKRLERGHLRVLAAIATFISSKTAKAWPGRALIAAATGLSLKTVSNLMLELRSLGYLIADKESVEEAGNRRLTVYTFGNIDHDTIRRQITEVIYAMREGRNPQKFPAHGELGSLRPGGSSPPTGNSVAQEFPAHGGRSSPPAGDSNSIKKLKEERGGPPGAKSATSGKLSMVAALNPEAAQRKAYAEQNVMVSKSGKVTIGPDFQAELLGEGYTADQIETALTNVCRYIEGSDPEMWMKTVRTACGWAKRDANRNATRPSKPTGVF